MWQDLLRRWYPRVLDEKYGGYFTNLTYDWHVTSEQEKMIVTQARHVWTNSKAAVFESHGSPYVDYALSGFKFLQEHMWDDRYGGFYQMRSREGGYTDSRGWGEEKRM